MFDKLCKKINVKVLICLYVFALGCAFVYINWNANREIMNMESRILSDLHQLFDNEEHTYYDVDYSKHSIKCEKIAVPKASQFEDIREMYKLNYQDDENGWSMYKIRLGHDLYGKTTIFVSKYFPYAVGYKKNSYSSESVREIVQSAFEWEQENEINSGIYNHIINALNGLKNDAYEIKMKSEKNWAITGTELFSDEETSSDNTYASSIYNNSRKCFIADSQPICAYSIAKRSDNMLKKVGFAFLVAFICITIAFIMLYIIINNQKKEDNTTEVFSIASFFKKLFSAQGRISRFDYLIKSLFTVGLLGFLVGIKLNKNLYLGVDVFSSPVIPIIIGLCALGIILLSISIFICQSTRRCHDLNKNGFYQFIPLYVLWLLFAKGDDESNKYDVCYNPKENQTLYNTTSPQPKKNVLLFVCAALGIALFVALFMLFKGSDDSHQSANQEQSKNVIQSNDTQNNNAQSGNNVQLDNKTQTNDNEPTNTDAQPNIPGDYPDARIRVLTASELSGYSKRELKLMRNEIFARHGYIFKTEDMKKYFSSKQWYEPKYNDVNSMLTDIEQQNIGTIKQLEK